MDHAQGVYCYCDFEHANCNASRVLHLSPVYMHLPTTLSCLNHNSFWKFYPFIIPMPSCMFCSFSVGWCGSLTANCIHLWWSNGCTTGSIRPFTNWTISTCFWCKLWGAVLYDSMDMLSCRRDFLPILPSALVGKNLLMNIFSCVSGILSWQKYKDRWFWKVVFSHKIFLLYDLLAKKISNGMDDSISLVDVYSYRSGLVTDSDYRRLRCERLAH